MKRTFIFIFISIILFSCSDKTQNTFENIWEDFLFNKAISNSTQIIIKSYNSKAANRRIYYSESSIPIKQYATKTKKQVEDFDKIFLNVEKTDYCCCPISSYSIHFLNKKEELDFFCVDTTEFKNKVRIFEANYQYSYIIEKQKWKNYLKEIENEQR